MKITVFLIVFSVASVIANSGHSQETKLSVQLKDASLGKILNYIEDNSHYYFMFNNELIDLSRKVDIDVQNKTIDEILTILFERSGINYKIFNRQVVLSPQSQANAGFSFQQQTFKVSGKVTDSSGEPLPGVSIVLKGTTTGVITDAQGSYSLPNIPSDATLVFSFVGMKSQEIAVAGKTSINIQMQEETVGIEEVVAIGYGTQKKVNLTGSVANINGDEITKRSVNNVQNLLQGKISGLEIIQGSGMPGLEDGVMRIRGIGTFSSAGNHPLVLINGVEGDMSALDPDNIESVSVLKDAASSAIYGSRAANGVILISTKSGDKGDVKIQYHANVQAHQATRLPELVTNSAEYMRLYNEALTRSGQTPCFTQEEIDGYRNNPNDPINYPNFDWVDYSFKTAIAQNHHINISGGNDKSVFNLALGYLDQDGIISNYGLKKYTGLLSVQSEIKSWITIGGNIQIVKKDIMSNAWGEDQILSIFGSGPNYTPTMTLPDGTTGYVAKYNNRMAWTVRNPEAQNASGSNEINGYSTYSQIFADIKLSKNLKWYSKAAFNFDYSFGKTHEHEVSNYYFKDGSYAHNNGADPRVSDSTGRNALTTFYSTLDFQKTFRESHNVRILVGYDQESNYYRNLSGSKTTFPLDYLKELSAGSALGQSTSGTSSEWALQSFFGRINYDYEGRYLLELNARYDGTSRISPENRWGFFPSLSAGWRISEEAFLKNIDWLSDFKLRGSYGQLGNQNVGLYPYQEILSTNAYPFNNVVEQTVVNTRLVDRSLKWETTSITDFGFNLNLKSGLITATFDWFNKRTDDILYGIPIPASVGLDAPTVNYGSMKNTGFELELGHNKKIGDFQYSVNLNFSSFKNEVLKVKTPSYGTTTIQEGLPFNSFYLIDWVGIFQNQEEIDNSPTHQYGPKPGDLKFRDAKEDGVINPDDRIVVDGAYPKFYYGGNINLQWRNFDLSAFFQGVEGQSYYVAGGWGFTPFMQGSPPTKEFVRNMWTGEGSTNSEPAMYWSEGYTPVTGTASTYWLKDASYLRLKNLIIGYDVPKYFLKRIGLNNVYVYASGDNLLTFTKFPKGGDPEKASPTGRFSKYPQTRIYTVGIKITL